MEYSPLHRLLPQPNFEPMTMMLIASTALSAGGSLIAGAGQANAQEAAGRQRQLDLEARAASQKFDAEIAERDAIELAGIGARDVDDFITENSKRAAANRAQRGGSGLFTGIDLEIFDEQRIEEGVRTLAGNTRRNVAAAKNKAVISRFNAQTNIASGKRINKAAKKSATFTRIGSILSAGGSALKGFDGASLASAPSNVQWNTTVRNI